MGRKDGFGRFDLLRFSPSSATLPPLLNLSSSSCHYSLLLPTLSGRAAVVGEDLLLLESSISAISSTLEPPLPSFQLHRLFLTPSSPFLQLSSNYPKLLLEPFLSRCLTLYLPSLRNYAPPHSHLNCFSPQPPLVFISLILLPKIPLFNYLPLTLNTIQNRSQSRYSRTPPSSTLGVTPPTKHPRSLASTLQIMSPSSFLLPTTTI